MFISIIVILISVRTCTAQVATCKDDGNGDPPNVLSSKLLKSGGNPAWAPSMQNINQGADHSIVRTMESYVQHRAEIKVLAYRVLLVHNVADDAAWFVHTVPNFLAYLSAYSWPQAETAKGHMFLCVSFNKAHLNSVGKAIRYQEPYVYVNNLPAAILNQHMELSNLINGIDVRVTPFLAHERFATKSVQAVANIQAFGKHSKSFADMYARILRNRFAASIMVWAPADARSKSICRGQHKLQKITSVQLDGVQVSRGADSAKWALIDGKNIVCFTTNDYTATDKRTPGAAVCLENAGVYNAFHMYARVLKNKFAANIRIWAPSDTRSKSICKGQYQLRKIASPMQFAGSQVSREADSARWAVVDGKNTVCLTTNDYKVGEKKIPGAAVCLENAGVYNAFSAAACSFRQSVPTLRYQLHGSLEHHQVVLKFFVYKPPTLLSTKIIKSERNPTWGNSAANIDQNAGHSISRTMERVLLVHNGANDAAAWFVHTAPNFLAHLGPYLWPAAETPKGHMFLCLSLTKAIRYQEPFIYANNLSPELLTQYNELSNLATGVEIRVTPFLEHAKFTTKSANGAAANIEAFGKHTKSYSGNFVFTE
ncbi:Plancitoxin-1, partial [Trichinella sp. T8]